MSGPAPSPGGSRVAAVAFVAGFVTAALIASAFVAFVIHRIGFATVWERTGIALGGLVLDIPDDLIDELTALGAVVGNADNPTGAREHDTFLVRPDDELGWVLRPDVTVDGYQIRAADPVNLDPPVVYLPAGARPSDSLREYLARNTLTSFRYSIDRDGFRRTIPEVRAERKLLMVGDSGLFGVSLDDSQTIASRLQQRLGDAVQVVNAGVAGYDGDQAFAVARDLAAAGDFESLVYVAHNNDFYEPRHISNPDKARAVIARFATLRERFPGGIAVALISYLEYTAEHVLRSSGWREERLRALDRFRPELARAAAEAGFAFVDWSDVVAEVAAREETPFAAWSLYVDHAHLSPRGAELFAERIEAALASVAQRR